jgi:hypothetical protein
MTRISAVIRNRRIAQNPDSTPKLLPAQALVRRPRKTPRKQVVRFDCSAKWQETASANAASR